MMNFESNGLETKPAFPGTGFPTGVVESLLTIFPTGDAEVMGPGAFGFTGDFLATTGVATAALPGAISALDSCGGGAC